MILPSFNANYSSLLDESRFVKPNPKDFSDINIDISNSIIIKNSKDYKRYTQDKSMFSIEMSGREVEISGELLNDLNADQGLNLYFVNNLMRKNGIGVRFYYFDGNEYQCIKYTVAEIIQALKVLNEVEENKFKDLYGYSAFSSYDSMIRTYNLKPLSFMINGEPYNCRADELLQFITIGDEEIIEIHKERPDVIEKDLSCLIVFFEQYKILDNYYLKREYVERFNRIKSNSLVDLNKYREYVKLTPEDAYTSRYLNEFIEPSSDFSFPEDENKAPLDYAIVTYIKLCDLLEYNPNYYINSSVSYGVNELSLKENKVSLESFIILYASLLKNHGIEVSLNKPESIVELCNSLSFNVGEHIIRVKANQSDIRNAKTGEALTGFTCHSNKISNKKCEELFDKYYEEYLQNKSYNASVTEYLDVVDQMNSGIIPDEADVESGIILSRGI